MARTRSERPERTTLPGIARVRITGDPEATARVLAVLAAAFPVTDPAGYPGARSHLEIDTRAPLEQP